MKKTILAAILSAASIGAMASDYYVVTPVKGKLLSLAAIQVALNSYALPDAVVGEVYAGFQFSSLLQVSGDPTFTSNQVRWSVTSGALPAGLTLNAATGELSGTPTVSGTANFTVRATYKTTTGETAFQFKVVSLSVALANTAAPAGKLNTAYSYDFTNNLSVTDTSGAPSAASWALVAGSLPSGLLLNTSTGVLAGTPTTVGTYNFTLKASYKTRTAQQAYSVAIADYVDYSALMGAYTKDAIGFTRHAAWSGAMGNTYFWNTAAGASGAAAGNLEVRRAVTVPNQTTAKVKYLVDDYISKIEVNGVVVYSTQAGNYNGTGYYTPAFTLRPGTNVVSVTFANTSGPGGFVAEIRDGSTDALLAPVSGWKMQ